MGKKILTVAFFVAGTAIGASVLGLPIDMRLAGFIPSVLVCIVMGVVMGSSQLLMALSFLDSNANDLPGMVAEKLGKFGGKLFTSTLTVLIFCLLVAFWIGAYRTLGVFPLRSVTMIASIICAAICLGYGFKIAGPVNTVLTSCMALSFICLTFRTIAGGNMNLLDLVNFKAAAIAMPIVMCSYGFFPVIPLACRYLDNDRKAIKKAVIFGATLPIIFNITTLAISFSVLTQQELAEGAANGWPVFVVLKNKLGSEALIVLGNLFSIFAILSSLFGVTTSMRGAFFDVCKGHGILTRFVEFVAILVIPLSAAISRPRIFIKILEFAGGILVNVLAGIIPVMVFAKGKSFNWKYVLLFGIFGYVFYMELINLFSHH
ncbi:MAG: hypothetical protein LBB18_03280 [Puniceicoccales bacterium]|jgi:tyrosine-specific transport protein|nr:hypothetical protein [Puniceicoccales bacterium]